ncbi:MAG: hypothetical protein WDA27_02515 [Actinomycetota bacterium]
MLQVDVFLSYGLSAGLAIASSKQAGEEESPLRDKYFVATVLWLALAFVPQVIYLCWRFPAWESMFVATSASDYPPWLASAAAIAMILMGVAGFTITRALLRKGKTIAAIAQVVWSVALPLFLVTYGWDGTGLKRMLYAGDGADWVAGVAHRYTDFLSSPVGVSLIWLEALALIPYAFLLLRALRESPKHA